MIKPSLKNCLHLYWGQHFVSDDYKDYTLHEINADTLETIECENDWDNIKFVLKPLSSITEDEMRELGYSHLLNIVPAEYCMRILNQKLILDGFLPNEFLYLLGKGFDLFGFIEAGLAYDKIKLQRENLI